MDFDPGEGEEWHTPQGQVDAFVTKLGPEGQDLWTRTFGGAGSVVRARGLAVDARDDDPSVYLTGPFAGTVDFDPTDAVDERTSIGPRDIFVTKFSADGSYLWTRTMGSDGWDQGATVHVDGTGAVLVVGNFESTCDFDPSDLVDSRTAHGESDIFVTKLLADGSYAWTHAVGGDDVDEGRGITTDHRDDVLVTGFYQSGSVDFSGGPGDDVHVSRGQRDGFVMKLSASGAYLWTETIGGSGDDVVRAVVADDRGGFVAAGSFGDEVDFDPSSESDVHSSLGAADCFITRRSAEGAYMWTGTFGGADSEFARVIAVEANDTVFVAGYFLSEFIDFDLTEGTDQRMSSGLQDAFVMKFSMPQAPRLTASDPPSGFIDPRQETAGADPNEQGIDRIAVTFSCAVRDAATGGPVGVSSFVLTDTLGSPPAIVEVVAGVEPHSFSITLSRPITAGAWTTLQAHVVSDSGVAVDPDPADRVELGFLPGDVDASLQSNALDVLALIDSLNGVAPLPLVRSDINRSEQSEPSDVLRLIDLLNGANASRAWNGASLPERP